MDINKKIKKIENRFNEDGTPKRDAISIMVKKQIINAVDAVDAGEKYETIKHKFNLKSIANI